MKFVFFSITEHPWGREMLYQLIDSGFIPSLVIERILKVGKQRGEVRV